MRQLPMRHIARQAACAVILIVSAPATWATPDADALAEHLTEHAPQCGRFEQSRWLADLETRLDSRGTFQRQTDALVWRTTAPIQDRVVLSDDNAELPLGFKIMLPVFTGLLSGDWQALRRHFTVALSGQLDDWQADLTPTETAVSQRLSRLVVSGNQQVEQVKLTFTSGDRLTLHLSAAACQTLDDDTDQDGAAS